MMSPIPITRPTSNYLVLLLLVAVQQMSGAANVSEDASNALSSNGISRQSAVPVHLAGGALGKEKKGAEAAAAIHHQHQSLKKLEKYLNERQRELITQNPGSLLAVARALKMAIVECQYQMRNEPWDCPIHGFSIKPTDVFGKLMSRSFKETSFIRSLLSSAIAHSVARACTESMIGCRRLVRNGRDDEHVVFGQEFAAEFMRATDELPPGQVAGLLMSNTIDKTLISNNMISPSSVPSGHNELLPMINYHKRRHIAANQQQQAAQTSSFIEREKKIRDWVNSHNDAVGRLQVRRGYDTMKEVCKCHGLSGACSVKSCWRKLPSFRDVANKLHESFDEAVRLTHLPQGPTNRRKPLTSASYKKSNKKRSSNQQPVNGLSRSSTSLSPASSLMSPAEMLNPYAYSSSNSLNSEPVNIIVSRPRGTKRQTTNTDNCEDCYRAPATLGRGAQLEANNPGKEFSSSNAPDNTTALPTIKRRPVARSIGVYEAPRDSLKKTDLVYFEDSPDFCVPSESFGFNGTKGRICSENPNVSNYCTKLCCGRGYKTEVREEKYKCDCQLKFCCKLDCNICTRRKIIHKCL